MILILDSHSLVWAALEPDLLSAKAREAIIDRTNRVLVSVVTAYELEFKRPRDPFLANLPINLDDVISGLFYEWLPLSHDQAAQAGRLPRHHGDPFDRLIIAQAFAEGAGVVTADRWFAAYGVAVVW
ncbi:MAG TPA: type II toxin-antitoxin system VapC family toxin [Caulobacteraceae bacterium]|nr:type II toxin-antitoxin system VapC family toxin [Caulobacteraceae bacterium]